jgi:glycosyltransferase involved in cell wall biosynthesis
MPSITALLHTNNDALRLGRALETLYACDDFLIVDHGSSDTTVRIAHEYGATVVEAARQSSSQDYLRFAHSSWILALDPSESLTESLATSLFVWKSQSDQVVAPAFSVYLREESQQGWVRVPRAQTRLVPRNGSRWQGKLPVANPSALALEGELLRFLFP